MEAFTEKNEEHIMRQKLQGRGLIASQGRGRKAPPPRALPPPPCFARILCTSFFRLVFHILKPQYHALYFTLFIFRIFSPFTFYFCFFLLLLVGGACSYPPFVSGFGGRTNRSGLSCATAACKQFNFIQH
jgi:hypothetical protein